MSIPGLGQLETQEKASQHRTIALKALWEWRFEVPFGKGGIAVRLVSGTAERDGTELALNQTYRFAGCKSKLLTWTSAELDVEGECEDYVAEYASPEETPMVSYLNLHFALQQRRAAAAAASVRAQGRGAHHHAEQQTLGPRVMVAGPGGSGKTSLVRSLAAWATRTGAQPIVVNADPHEGMLSLPGTLSAAVFASIMDVESGAGGWGGAPSSGPSAVPVKLPLVHYFGREKIEEELELYRALVGKLAGAATARMSEDREVGVSGCLIDAPAVNLGKGGVDVLAHIVEEFSVNTIIVLGSARINTELVRRLASEKTSLGEPISIVLLDKSEGVVERDDAFMKQLREATIKEYFFGDFKRSLDPTTQIIDYDTLTIYKIPEPLEGYGVEEGVVRAEADPSMESWILTVMNASNHDSVETIQQANVLGFLHVASVDESRRKLRVLAPSAGRLGDRPVIWGRWPEPNLNLLG